MRYRFAAWLLLVGWFATDYKLCLLRNDGTKSTNMADQVGLTNLST